MRALGDYLRDARKALFASQAKAAAAFGTSTSSIKRWEKGEAVPLEYAVWLARQCEISLDELLGLPPSGQPREVVLLIDGAAWVAHAERRTEVQKQWGQAAQGVRAFSEDLARQSLQNDRRRGTR